MLFTKKFSMVCFIDFENAAHTILSNNDPEPDVPKDVTPMAQCAFESLMFNVSAVYTN